MAPEKEILQPNRIETFSPESSSVERASVLPVESSTDTPVAVPDTGVSPQLTEAIPQEKPGDRERSKAPRYKGSQDKTDASEASSWQHTLENKDYGIPPSVL
ncbi:hypothetical protein GX888_00305 [Candidatus Dojkabacteria bacterium]|uniref:Uncharacterized protein n=1 Tax=Candidatus Dojkabacteria bacterium TaxID=2099670 RepID=A0A847VCJ1_9BACT|nr:hypothetical protein [Candidatus Dojkabacteria bacterium]